MRTGLMLFCVLLQSAQAKAQDTPEARLRDMLRRTTAELRALQDSQALLQAAFDQEKQRSALLQQQLDAMAAQPAAKPLVSEDAIARLRAESQSRVAALEAGLKQWQDAYQKAADVARAKDADSKAATARAAESEREASVCAIANTKLEGVANDILHLYQSRGFRSLLLESYEPVLGLKKVELENTIQDYEDKLYDQKYRAGHEPAAATLSR